MRTAILILAALLAAAALIYALRPAPAPLVPPVTPLAAPAPQPTAPTPAPAATTLTLLNTPDAQHAIAAVEQMIKPRRAGILASPEEHGRFICVLVDGDERFYTLDLDVTENDLPFLKQYGFASAPSPLDRTTSRYKSVAKTALHYDETAGDRMIVLVCPAQEWGNLKIPKPTLHFSASNDSSQRDTNSSGF